MLSYERPPLVTGPDIWGQGGITTVGLASSGYAIQQRAAQAAGALATPTAAGPRFIGTVNAQTIAIGILVAIALAYVLHHRLL